MSAFQPFFGHFSYSPQITLNHCNLSEDGETYMCCVGGRSTSGLQRLEYMPKHDDVMKWKHFPRYWPFVRGISRSGEIPQRPVTRRFDAFFDLHPLSKQSWAWWFETASHSLWRHCNDKDDKPNDGYRAAFPIIFLWWLHAKPITHQAGEHSIWLTAAPLNLGREIK